MSFTIPRIFDADGKIDPKKPWYIIYYYEGVRFREKFGINREKNKAKRYLIAEKYRAALEELLKEGFNPNDVMEQLQELENKNLISVKFAAIIEHIKPTVAQKTFDSYKSTANRFILYAQQTGLLYVEDVKKKHIKEYDYYLQTERNLSAKSRGNVLGFLSAIFNRFINEDEERVLVNPCVGVKKEKKSSGEKQIPWTKEEYQTLRDYTYKNHFNVWIYCNFIYFCGTRSTETSRIKRKDIDLINQVLVVHSMDTKVTHTDTVIIPNLFIADLKKYCEKIKPDQYLFSTDLQPGDKKLHSNRIFEVTKKVVKEGAGIRKDVYQLKHTSGILMNKMGMPKQMIQRHFRHSSVATTEIYFSNMKAYLNDDIKNKFPDINAI